MRKNISKKTRFEVFKRDSFKCQYCGLKAPDVILEIDHIKPISKGGDNSIMNLVTSCFNCNRGKSNIELSDNSSLSKELNQLTQIQERKNQIDLMLKWREELKNENNKIYQIAFTEYCNKLNNEYHLTEIGKKNMVKLVDKYGILEVLNSIDKVSQTKLRIDYKTDKIIESDIDNFLTNISKHLNFSKMTPLNREIAYYKGIVKNHFGFQNPKYISTPITNLINHLKVFHTDVEIVNLLKNDLKDIIFNSKNISTWKKNIEELTGGCAE